MSVENQSDWATLDSLPPLSGIPLPEQQQLLSYFKRVTNRNWKKHINACIQITPDEIPLVAKAISMFTGSREIEITEEAPGKYRVMAEGYYNAIGD